MNLEFYLKDIISKDKNNCSDSLSEDNGSNLIIEADCDEEDEEDKYSTHHNPNKKLSNESASKQQFSYLIITNDRNFHI